MPLSLEALLQLHPRPYITDAELSTWLTGSADSRYSKVKRLLAQGTLLHLRRGLYCITASAKPHPYELAQRIYGPSYISLESALSYHSLIPEAVFTITSVTSKRRKSFETPLGIFTYHSMPLSFFYTDVEIIKEENTTFLMAKPWKAICDYVYCYKKNWKNMDPLLNSLRINEKNLPLLQNEEIESLDEYYQHSRIHRFLKGIQHDLLKKR